MRHLILLRHAKSSWVNPDLDDFDRPLNKRGRRSAKALGGWLRAAPWKPDIVLCSAARRARETWEGLELAGEPVLRKDLYHASPNGMRKVLGSAAGETVLMIGHNPGIGALAQTLVRRPPDHHRFQDFPTGSLLVAAFDSKEWSGIGAHMGKVETFLTPHDLVDSDA